MVPDGLKGFQPDFREQSELVHSHFRATAVHSAFAVTRSLKRNAERKFRKKNEYVDKGKFAGSEKPLALSLSPLFAGVDENCAAR